MTKTKNATSNNGRWLIIDTQSPTNDMIVASLKKIDGTEIKVISHKTYVRFNKPVNKSSHDAMVSRITRAIKKYSTRVIREDIDDKIKHYCAVILK